MCRRDKCFPLKILVFNRMEIIEFSQQHKLIIITDRGWRVLSKKLVNNNSEQQALCQSPTGVIP